MNCTIEFYHKADGSERPYDACQEMQISSNNGNFLPLPNVGDTVYINMFDGHKHFKVLFRNFLYISEAQCKVSIVVGDVSEEEMAGRIRA